MIHQGYHQKPLMRFAIRISMIRLERRNLGLNVAKAHTMRELSDHPLLMRSGCEAIDCLTQQLAGVPLGQAVLPIRFRDRPQTKLLHYHPVR